VRDRHTGFLTATLRVAPVSTWLADSADADRWVANWAAWLASLGYLPSLRWVTVTVDTAPDPGSTLTDQVAAPIDTSAPRPAVRRPMSTRWSASPSTRPFSRPGPATSVRP